MELRIFGGLGAIPLYNADGRLTDEATRKFVGQLLQALADWTLQLRRR